MSKRTTWPWPELTIHVDRELEGSYIVEAYGDGSGWRMTSASGKQVVASAATPEPLVKYGRKRGAKRVEIFR